MTAAELAYARQHGRERGRLLAGVWRVPRGGAA